MNRNLLAPRDLRKAEQAYTNAGRPTLKWRRRKHWLRVCDRYFRHTPELAKRRLHPWELSDAMYRLTSCKSR